MSLKKPKPVKLSRMQQRCIDSALHIVATDWKATGIAKMSAEKRQEVAESYRTVAAHVDGAGRKGLAQTVRFLASEIALGVGLGPYSQGSK